MAKHNYRTNLTKAEANKTARKLWSEEKRLRKLHGNNRPVNYKAVEVVEGFESGGLGLTKKYYHVVVDVA